MATSLTAHAGSSNCTCSLSVPKELHKETRRVQLQAQPIHRVRLIIRSIQSSSLEQSYSPISVTGTCSNFARSSSRRAAIRSARSLDSCRSAGVRAMSSALLDVYQLRPIAVRSDDLNLSLTCHNKWTLTPQLSSSWHTRHKVHG